MRGWGATRQKCNIRCYAPLPLFHGSRSQRGGIIKRMSTVHVQCRCHLNCHMCSCTGISLTGRQCPNGTMDSECGTPCRPTCLNPSPEFCITSCAKGCFCPTGMLQLDAYTLECFPRLLCAVDPCSVTQCHAYPNAVCKPDSCTCNARFLVDGEEIKDCKSECVMTIHVCVTCVRCNGVGYMFVLKWLYICMACMFVCCLPVSLSVLWSV